MTAYQISDYQVNLAISACIKTQRNEPDCEATKVCSGDDLSLDGPNFTTTWELTTQIADFLPE